MKNDDVQLIHRILDGDDTAFTELVKKYQKSVHALAWRKIGDFHIAEEITQDTFLKAYQNLGALKKPQRFASWLYVIASRRCVAWLRKKRVRTQPLEDTSSLQVEKATYSQYVIEENERTAIEAQREVVKKLLARLPESERTIITLHYFSEMSSAEIGAFLGVSANTIRSRLRRAQQRLQKEETMIREALDHFQISPNLTDNIMQEVNRLKPAAPSVSKPLIPWVIGAASAALIVLLLGIGSQHLVRFQQPYSLEAQTETTVELIDAPVVLNVDAKTDVRRQLGSVNALGKSDNNGQKTDEVLLAAAQSDEEGVSVPKQQWIQSAPTGGSYVESLLETSEGVLYTLARGHIYKLQDDKTEWQHISDISTLIDDMLAGIPMAEWDNTLYIVPSNKLYASKDDGKTWNLVHEFPDEYDFPTELLLTEQAFYIIFDKGAFRSEDKGKTWKNINDEFPSEPNSIVTVQDTVFALAGKIYRWNSGSWQRLAEFPVPQAKSCFSITATKDKLYAFTINSAFDPNEAAEGERSWWIFRSTDLGNSWKDITPTHVWKSRVGWLINITLFAAGDTLLAIEQGMVRSTDGGDTWMPLQVQPVSPSVFSNSAAAVLNEHVFYISCSDRGLRRSTDEGKSWNIVNVFENRGGISHLIAVKETHSGQSMPSILYGSDGDMVKTTNGGKSWSIIPTDMPMTTWQKEDPPDITQIVKSNGVIYAKGSSSLSSAYGKGETRIYSVSTDGNMLVPIQDMPIFDPYIFGHLLSQRKPDLPDEAFVKQLQESASGATLFFKQLAQKQKSQQQDLRRLGLRGAFAVSGGTFYMEYNYKLFRWEPGETAWHDTGLEETKTDERTLGMAFRLVGVPREKYNEVLAARRQGFKIAVSGNTVYVGKRDRQLVLSYDKGNNWIDVTPILPFPVIAYKDIVFAGSTVYVATDAGVAASDDGKNWRTITDIEGTNLNMDKLTVDGSTLYGVTKRSAAYYGATNFYRLKSGTWEKIASEVPNRVTSFAVDGNTLYIGTQNSGMLHFTLEE
ncbi:MAG: sigma-70 family RNA polymerase sigma factor [Candidatus Poribacteria bacterium]|nr:sigma-70 family RNA polymerase sigma factor [Candidatus Poribacteria bacterium]